MAAMSKVAGHLSVQAADSCPEQPHGELGMLLRSVPGVDPESVVVVGADVAGTQTIHIAVGMGAEVLAIDHDARILESAGRTSAEAPTPYTRPGAP